MASLTTDDISHIAKLSNLVLKENEVDKFKNQLSDILTFVDKLKEVNVEGVDPTSQTTGLTNVYRSDNTNTDQTLTQVQALSGSDEVYNGYFKVGAILKGRTDK